MPVESIPILALMGVTALLAVVAVIMTLMTGRAERRTRPNRLSERRLSYVGPSMPSWPPFDLDAVDTDEGEIDGTDCVTRPYVTYYVEQAATVARHALAELHSNASRVRL